MMKTQVLGFLGMLLCLPGCAGGTDLGTAVEGVQQPTLTPGYDDPPGPPGRCDEGRAFDVVGTWAVVNHGAGTTGRVTFKPDGTYRVDSGSYAAGGTDWQGNTSGTYTLLPGGSIGFRYANWTAPIPLSRIAVVRCAGPNQIVHFVMAHSHDYEQLTRLP